MSDDVGSVKTHDGSVRPSEESAPSQAHARNAASNIGELLRGWRAVRRLTQLELAHDAEISMRHLSYIETGRAQPSREMVLRLAEALEVPLRERNALLLAAGFAPLFRHSRLDTPEMDEARGAVALILEHQNPFPAFVVDRYWNILLENEGTKRLLALFPQCASVLPHNAVRLAFHPEGLRPFIENWEDVAARIIQRVHRASVANPADETMRAFLAELLAYPDVPNRWRMVDLESPPPPVLTINYGHQGRTLRLFSTVTTFGTPQDIALQELRIECFFPADEATRSAFATL
jgi:transcriptional regulator with XRE-family HTH domain